MLELNELLELEEVIRDVLNDDLERILILEAADCANHAIKN